MPWTCAMILSAVWNRQNQVVDLQRFQRVCDPYRHVIHGWSSQVSKSATVFMRVQNRIVITPAKNRPNRAAFPSKADRDAAPLPKPCSKFQCKLSSAPHQVLLADKTLKTQWMSDVTCCGVCQWRTYVGVARKLCVLASPFAVFVKWPKFCLFCTANLRPRIRFANVCQMTDCQF